MIIKNGLLRYTKEANIGTAYGNRIIANFEVYEKTEGSYSEYVIRMTDYTDISLDADNNETYCYEGQPTKYKVIPMPNMARVCESFENINDNDCFTWTSPLSEV